MPDQCAYAHNKLEPSTLAFVTTEKSAELAELGTSRGRGIIFATVLGSGVSFLDGLIVNIALPQMDTDLDLGVSGFQWTVSGYLLTLSALLLDRKSVV